MKPPIDEDCSAVVDIIEELGELLMKRAAFLAEERDRLGKEKHDEWVQSRLSEIAKVRTSNNTSHRIRHAYARLLDRN